MWIMAKRTGTQSSVELAESRSPEHLKIQMTSIINALGSSHNICRVYNEDEEDM